MMYGPTDEDGIRRVELGGRSLRLVQFTEPVRSFSVILWGQSGDPNSPHADDQVALLSEKRVRSTYFDPAELDGHVERSYTVEVP